MDICSISIGGKAYPVPPLTLGQIKTVVPAVISLRDLNPETITAAQIVLLTDIAFQGASKGTPTLTRTQFDDLPGTIAELIVALPIVARQAGMSFREGGAAGEPSTPNP